MRTDVSGWQVRLDDALIQRYTASGDWPGKTLADFAYELAARDPGRVTHVFGEQRCTVSELLAELAELSPKVAVRTDGTDARKPSFSVGRPGEPARIRSAGIPMGRCWASTT